MQGILPACVMSINDCERARTSLPVVQARYQAHCTTVQVSLVKMQRVMKHDKYVAVSTIDTGECMDLSFFKMPRKAET